MQAARMESNRNEGRQVVLKRKPMPPKRWNEYPNDPRTNTHEVIGGPTVSRRELVYGAAATGTALFLTPESSLAETNYAYQLLVGAAKRIITPNPLLPVSGGMGPTH